MKSMKLFYAETGLGTCLKKGRDEKSVRKQLLEEVGSYNGVQLVREADKGDIAWVEAMGGKNPRKT